jgi:hypothetical protein
MKWSDLFQGDLGQNLAISELRDQVERARAERDRMDWDVRKVREVAEEALELHLRLAVLLRLLIAKGVITAEEYASLLTAARPKPRGDGA